MSVETSTLPLLLRELRLSTMGHLWEDLYRQAMAQGWTPAHYLRVLCEHEISCRGNKRLARYMAEAQLPKGKTLSTFDFSVVPMLNKNQIIGFATGDIWIKEAKNVLLFGPSGGGKSHLAAAIGEGLITAGYRVLFTRTTDLLQKLQLAKQSLGLPATLEKLNKYDCLICDDWGYVKKDQSETSVLFELISERYESKSMIITCNQPFAEWDKIFTDTTMACAAVDRLIHHAHIFELNVESYRKSTALTRMKNAKGGSSAAQSGT